MSKRKITTKYLNDFIGAIKKGNPVTYVAADNLLAVDHPEQGWLVIQMKDKVLGQEPKALAVSDESDTTSGSE